MKYFFDTEFYEDGRTIDLISIGIVCEDGREYYAISEDAELHQVSDWVRVNVLPQLPKYGSPEWKSRRTIAQNIFDFVHEDKPEFWAHYADYDWVVLCQLFGTMMQLPAHFPKYCMDLKQLCKSLGNPTLLKQESGEHNALEDARWNKKNYDYLMGQGEFASKSIP